MQARKIKEGIYSVGAVDWDSRMFDNLIPLPDGTSYNAFLVQGSEKTALIDTVDAAMSQWKFFHWFRLLLRFLVYRRDGQKDYQLLIPGQMMSQLP